MLSRVFHNLSLLSRQEPTDLCRGQLGPPFSQQDRRLYRQALAVSDEFPSYVVRVSVAL